MDDSMIIIKDKARTINYENVMKLNGIDDLFTCFLFLVNQGHVIELFLSRNNNIIKI